MGSIIPSLSILVGKTFTMPLPIRMVQQVAAHTTKEPISVVT